MTNVAVLGAGAWGTAIACALAGAPSVVLYARDPRQARRQQGHAAPTSAICRVLRVPPELTVDD